MKKGGGSESTIVVGPSKSCLRAPQLRIRPRPCPISGFRAKIIIIIKIIKIINIIKIIQIIKIENYYYTILLKS